MRLAGRGPLGADPCLSPGREVGEAGPALYPSILSLAGVGRHQHCLLPGRRPGPDRLDGLLAAAFVRLGGPRGAQARVAGLTSGAEFQVSLMPETCALAHGDTTTSGRAARSLAEAFSANLSRKPQSSSTPHVYLLSFYYMSTISLL